MKPSNILFFAFVALMLATSCDMRSGTAKEEMEKFSRPRDPEPVRSPTPELPPIDPAEVVQVDTSLEGENLTVNGYGSKQTLNCNKFNAVKVNGDKNVATIKGACRQIMINGDDNQIAVDSATELVFNGSANQLTYSHFANGQRPVVTENLPGNDIQHVSAGGKDPSNRGENSK